MMEDPRQLAQEAIDRTDGESYEEYLSSVEEVVSEKHPDVDESVYENMVGGIFSEVLHLI
jgi:hypothetical protein